MGQIDIIDKYGTIILDPLNLTFKKTVTFEGKEYNNVDFSKLEDWSCDDVINVTKKFNKMTGADINPMDAILPEGNLEYCLFVAAEASGLPIDFFKRLPAREAGALRGLIINFFHGSV
jgi:hypothetical protein